MKKVLLLGCTGQLGWELWRSLAPLGEVLAFDYPQIDFSSPETVKALVLSTNPDAVINAVAYTDVDKAEAEVELSHAVNATTPGELASACQQVEALFVHFSTDYVFDGTLGRPLTETDQPHPLNVYGRTKLEGEELVCRAGGSYLIFRTSWVYSLRRSSFVTKVIDWAAKNETVHIVNDQISGPTWARMLAQTVTLMIARAEGKLNRWFSDKAGIYHLAGSGFASRYRWAEEILRLHQTRNAQMDVRLVPTTSDKFPTPAMRPTYSALDCSKFTETFDLLMPDWKISLAMAMDQTETKHTAVK